MNYQGQMLRVKIGDKVSEGSPVLVLESAAKPAEDTSAPASAAKETAAPASPARESTPAPQTAARAPDALTGQKPSAQQRAAEDRPQPTQTLARAEVDEASFAKVHASPAVRRLAREFGVDLSKVKGSGPKERILKEDVQGYVKAELTRPRAAPSARPQVAPQRMDREPPRRLPPHRPVPRCSRHIRSGSRPRRSTRPK